MSCSCDYITTSLHDCRNSKLVHFEVLTTLKVHFSIIIKALKCQHIFHISTLGDSDRPTSFSNVLSRFT